MTLSPTMTTKEIINHILDIEVFAKNLREQAKTLEEEAKKGRAEVLERFTAMGITGFQHDDATVSVRTRTDKFVKEDDLRAHLKEIDDETFSYQVAAAVWPPTFNQKAALGFAEANNTELIRSQEHKSLVVTPKKSV